MSVAEDIIESSIKHCQDIGVKIVRGPLLVFNDEYKPIACDCFGAVLIVYNKAIPSHLRKEGWLKEDLCKNILGKDFNWWWKFSFGFNQGRSLSVYKEVKDHREYFEDKVSTAGNNLARKLGFYSI